MKTAIIGCSGASNTGAYSDLAARKLAKTGNVKMLCLARFGVDEKFSEQMKNEIDEYIVLDGCPINCAEIILKNTGINKYTHINTTDYGIVKGKTPVSDEKIDEIVKSLQNLL